MMRRDWFTFANRATIAAELAEGPKDLIEIASGIWGIPGMAVVCLGDRAHMRKVQAKRYADRFHATPCPKGKYDDDCGGPSLPSVADRLAT